MKLIYSHLQKLLPQLDVTPQKLRDDLTMIGHWTNYFEEIEGETVFDLDIKVNRGDCLGYYGLAKDLAVYYKIPLITPDVSNLASVDIELPISVTSADVYRVMCLKLSKIKVGPSPEWLVKFAKIHQVNSVNNIVDLTNYIMFLYGIPNHTFDVAKTGENLIWENNHGKTTDFTTLDGTIFKLTDDNLVISNPTEVVSTDFVGGKFSGTYDSTTDVIIEVAIYNPVRIRIDSRQHKTVTEAGIRLEKSLDCNLVPQALKHLAQLITELGNGQVNSQIFDYYPNPEITPPIEFDFQMPSRLSGIEISEDFGKSVLTQLGCTMNGSQITPPTIRKDIIQAEDLAEEVIRFYGYFNIPSDQPLPYKVVKNITPKEIYLIDLLKDKLVELGYDEVLTWPLVSLPSDPKTVITTQNSINSESIYLRQSLIPSLRQQLSQYQRFKLPKTKFFEIGHVFNLINGNFIETNSLGIYNNDQSELTSDLEKLNLTATLHDENFVEINLETLPKPEVYTPKVIDNKAIELTSQIITLDANVNLEAPEDPLTLIEKYSKMIDPGMLWSMEITDIYQTRYTFRVCYYNVDDKTAKQVHLDTFNLN